MHRDFFERFCGPNAWVPPHTMCHHKPQTDNWYYNRQTLDSANSRQANTRHDKHQTGKHQTQQTLDMNSIKESKCQFCLMFYYVLCLSCPGFVISSVCYVQGLSCLVFVCLGSVEVPLVLLMHNNAFLRTCQKNMPSNEDLKAKKENLELIKQIYILDDFVCTVHL